MKSFIHLIKIDFNNNNLIMMDIVIMTALNGAFRDSLINPK
ncbi:14714_t:CDS:2 [Dentiscutata erythropus]|uniref:14714_t:CDS:1 n=1 Tax=Dentiscutata erythropus TaxID=1348616 RepID=A0A9N9FYB4_9GLOM|nr:14714_t:CDS:2 [Dentiscutata erythropus]